MLEKKVTVSGLQLAKTIIRKTLDSHARSSLPAVSIHILLNFLGYIVQGSVESFECGKSSVGAEFRQSYRLFELSTTVQLQFIQASPTLAQEWPVHYTGPATTKSWGAGGGLPHVLENSPKVGVLEGTFFLFHIVIFLP